MTDIWYEHPGMKKLLDEERRWNMRARKVCMFKGHKWVDKFGGDTICQRCSKWKGYWR